MSKNTIIRGTIILTIGGLLTRLIGFFYKIYLADLLGAEMIGVYQLVFPVYGICFTLYASGLQTSISTLIARELGKKNMKNTKKILKIGLSFSVTLALFLSFVIYTNSEEIAKTFLREQRAASSLRVLALVFPFCGITSCINGYYYGIKKAGVPALSQLLEQIIRVLSVSIISIIMGKGNVSFTCELAVYGIVFGEIASNLFNIFSLLTNKQVTMNNHYKNNSISSVKTISKDLLKLSLPLTSNRLFISILQSFEAILIPNMLKVSGLSTKEALSVYGILTGMSMPFILFPSTITNSLAVMLLPAVSEAQAANNNKMINRTASISIKYSILIGILSTGIFVIFGQSLGTIIFHSKMSGNFLVVLAWLCPFLYLTTTLGSIINGLGKAHLTFFNTVVGLSIRILFISYLVPKKGISGYLIGLLISQLVISALDFIAIHNHATIKLDATNWILKPALIILFLGFLIHPIYQFITVNKLASPIFLLFLCCFVLCVIYIILLFITKTISIKEFSKNKY